MKTDYSDTMAYIEECITPYWEQCKEYGDRVGKIMHLYTSKANRNVLLADTASKWSFLHTDGKIVNVGEGIKQDGLWFSNRNFEDRYAPAFTGRATPSIVKGKPKKHKIEREPDIVDFLDENVPPNWMDAWDGKLKELPPPPERFPGQYRANTMAGYFM